MVNVMLDIVDVKCCLTLYHGQASGSSPSQHSVEQRYRLQAAKIP
jgi:hypothetical protein